MKKRLDKGDETRRRWKIIDSSQSRDASMLPQLLARLERGETYQNRRHIVRALANIGGPAVETKLLELVQHERGLILGDIAHGLGHLASRRSLTALEKLRNHKSEWVRQNALFAIRRLSKRREN